MVSHPHGARREDHQISIALALELELGALHPLPDLVVADLERRPRGLFRGVLDGRDLLLPKPAEIFRLGRVMPVTIDDHGTFTAGEGVKGLTLGREGKGDARDLAPRLSNRDFFARTFC